MNICIGIILLLIVNIKKNSIINIQLMGVYIYKYLYNVYVYIKSMSVVKRSFCCEWGLLPLYT